MADWHGTWRHCAGSCGESQHEKSLRTGQGARGFRLTSTRRVLTKSAPTGSIAATACAARWWRFCSAPFRAKSWTPLLAPRIRRSWPQAFAAWVWKCHANAITLSTVTAMPATLELQPVRQRPKENQRGASNPAESGPWLMAVMAVEGGKRGDAGRDPGAFIAVPCSVIDCHAYICLSHPARSLLIEIARQFVRDNNGRLLASAAYLSKRGWSSSDTITRAKRELLAAGFIHQTVQGHRAKQSQLVCRDMAHSRPAAWIRLRRDTCIQAWRLSKRKP